MNYIEINRNIMKYKEHRELKWNIKESNELQGNETNYMGIHGNIESYKEIYRHIKKTTRRPRKYNNKYGDTADYIDNYKEV